MIDILLGTIEKNAREEIRVSFSEFKGHDLIDIRVYAISDGEAIATRKGIAFKIDKLPELADLLRDAVIVAQQNGDLEG